MSVHPLRSAAVAALVLSASACVSFEPADTRPESQTRHVIDSDALEGMERLSVYDAIRRIHPHWLRTRGPSTLVNADRETLMVYLDGMYLGSATSLKRLSVRTVHEMRYLDARQATTRYGTGHSAGALEISSLVVASRR